MKLNTLVARISDPGRWMNAGDLVGYRRSKYPCFPALSALLFGSWVAMATALELTSVTLDDASGPDALLTICFTTIENNRYLIESTEVAEPATWVEIPSTVTLGDGLEHCVMLIQSNGTSFARLQLVSGFIRTIEAESLNASAGIIIDATSISGLNPGGWARFDNIDLGGIDTIEFVLATTSPGERLQLRIGSSTGTIVAELTVDGTGGLGMFALQSTGVLPTSGIHTLYLTSPDSGNIAIDRFVLKAEGPTITIPGTYGFGTYGGNAYGE